jgi:hypothetical protein
MKYVIVQSNGAVEVREDSYEISTNAFVLTDDDYNKLLSGTHIFLNGLVIDNPEPLKIPT